MMTLDEAKKVFLNRGFIEVDGGKWREACYVISQWLKQEPSEDCISRQAVLDGKVIHQSCDGIEIISSYAVPVEYIEQLPSVRPLSKTGYCKDCEWWKDSDEVYLRSLAYEQGL